MKRFKCQNDKYTSMNVIASHGRSCVYLTLSEEGRRARRPVALGTIRKGEVEMDE